jgi:hypothetical protein
MHLHKGCENPRLTEYMQQTVTTIGTSLNLWWPSEDVQITNTGCTLDLHDSFESEAFSSLFFVFISRGLTMDWRHF